jgi:hypothetical protein
MRANRAGLISVAAAAMMIAFGSADAQGKSKANGSAKVDKAASASAKGSTRAGDVVRTRDGNVIWRDGRVEPDRRDGRVERDRRDGRTARTVYGNGTKVPPGLAKKPGQMPPGQYKKVYSTRQGAGVLEEILRRRGYAVQGISTYGDAHAVYYRRADGSIARALVSQRNDRLGFTNIPAVVLQEVVARLY